MQKSMGSGFEGLGTVSFDISPGNFTVILLITFDFQHFQPKGYVIIHT